MGTSCSLGSIFLWQACRAVVLSSLDTALAMLSDPAGPNDVALAFR